MLNALIDAAVPVTMFITATMAAFLFYCLCGCKAKERKEEFTGIEGHVKMRNIETEPEANASNAHTMEGANSAKRSLPDLPVDNVVWDANGDGASELYATVGKQPENSGLHAAVPPLRPDHPYDKVRRVEHPYAQVNGAVASTSQEVGAVGVPIAAATAIAGHVPASDDLPYVTPPPHFSGDSQDSAKGYTSISVREPLAEILAESRRSGPVRTASDYATLSDDSDDMYAAIEDPASGSETYAQIAQPPPVQLLPRQELASSGASTSAVNSPKPDKREAKSPLPPPPPPELLAPPSVDDMYAKVNKKRRRELEDSFQRGPSTESGSSESVSYKLQTSYTESNHSCHSHPTTESSSSSGVSHPCCGSHSTTTPSSKPPDGTDSSLSSDGETHGSYERLDPPYETLSCKKRIAAANLTTSDPNYETLGSRAKHADLGDDATATDSNYETLGSRAKQSDPGYETLGARNKTDPGYETLVGDKVDSAVEPCYETLACDPPSEDPCYETLGSGVRREHRYEPIRTLYENGTSDPTYETLGTGGSDSDPNYERIGVPHEDGYALVVKRRHGDHEKVPLFNSLGSAEPPYSSLVGGEPPYSSLNPLEPPYSSLNILDTPGDPPYQRLSDFESGLIDK